jgi:uncharacterized protein YndB with AHSA1/START domain
LTSFDHSILLSAAPTRVLGAFTDAQALTAWWQASRAVVAARPLGVFAIEWEPAVEADDLLGRLGGIFHGTVVEYKAGRMLMVADAWWLPPDTDPIGPMALEVTCMMEGPACRLRVHQTGFEDSPRWQRYYAVIDRGWRSSLASLKDYLEGL